MGKTFSVIVFSKDLNNLQQLSFHKNPNYVWFEATKTFVFRPKLREIKNLLDEGKSVKEINELYRNGG